MTKRFGETLLWSGLFALLLLAVITPLGIISIHFIMIPLVILVVRLNRFRFALSYGIALLAVSALLGGGLAAFCFIISTFFLIPAGIIGYLYKRKTAARTVVTAASVTLLAEMLLLLVIAALSGFNIEQQLTAFFQESVSQVPDTLRMGLSNEALAQTAELMTRLIPFALIGSSIIWTGITHSTARRILVRLGEDIPGLRPIREWMLPKSLVWYYLAALIIDLFVKVKTDSALGLILWNLIPLLTFTFAVQAVCFLFYIAHERKWNYTLPIIGIVMFIFLPNLLSMLGVLDTAFDLRGRIKSNK